MYQAVIERFIQEFGDGPVEQVTPEQILTFLNRLTDGNKPYTKRIRYSQISSFFNFVRNNIDPELRNPCDRPMIRKLYRERVMVIKSGNLVGVKLRPHDLRRHSATYASRSGVPIEIVSKVILRYANLATTKPFNCVSSKLIAFISCQLQGSFKLPTCKFTAN